MKSEIEIFRTGTHTDMNGHQVTISRADLMAMAGAYDPEFHEAPIVLGHPENNDPAMGWVKSLAVTDEGVLNAQLHQVNPDFSEAVNSGAFKKISASLYLPGALGNPAGDNYGLRHVGFLGAQVPAIKGLKAVSFADGDEASVFVSDFGEREHGWLFRNVASAFKGLREFLIDNNGLDAADKALPSYVVENLSESASDLINSDLINSDRAIPAAFSEDNPPPKTQIEEPEMDDDAKAKAIELSEREESLKAKENDLAQKAASFAESQKKARAEKNANFLDGVIKQGKLAAGHKGGVLAFMDKIDGDEIVSFSEGSQKTALAFFKDMLTAAKPVVDFGEHTGDDNQNGLDRNDAKSITDAALIYQEEQNQKGNSINIAAAVRHVKKED